MDSRHPTTPRIAALRLIAAALLFLIAIPFLLVAMAFVWLAERCDAEQLEQWLR